MARRANAITKMTIAGVVVEEMLLLGRLGRRMIARVEEDKADQAKEVVVVKREESPSPLGGDQRNLDEIL